MRNRNLWKFFFFSIFQTTQILNTFQILSPDSQGKEVLIYYKIELITPNPCALSF